MYFGGKEKKETLGFDEKRQCSLLFSCRLPVFLPRYEPAALFLV
jgi:hypothetical protein